MKYLRYCKNPSFEMIKLLIDSGSKINKVSKSEDTILHYAASN